MSATCKPNPLQNRNQVSNSQEITLLLQQWRSGDQAAEGKLFELLMPELRRIAGRCLGREHRNHTLQRTELVNEVFIKLHKAKDIDWQDRGHFFAIAIRMMRRYLIEHVRQRPKAKLVALEGVPEEWLAGRTRMELIITVDNLLDDLEKIAP